MTQKYKKYKIKNVRTRKREEKAKYDDKIKELREMALIEYLQHLRDEKEDKLN